jgi:hypothetical protein
MPGKTSPIQVVKTIAERDAASPAPAQPTAPVGRSKRSPRTLVGKTAEMTTAI